MSETVGRFAPSPSGPVHLGNIACCLLAYLSARHQGGRFLLRIEDLDHLRCPPAYGEQVIRDLEALGFDWDEEPLWQSRRGKVYEDALSQLSSHLYPCFCTRGELHAPSAPHASDGTPVYAGTCRALSSAQRAEKAKLRRPSLRIRVPEREIAFTDGLQGLYAEHLSRDCGDFILRRSDGVYAYQLAVVVDDALMGVNQVVRGRDLLSSTPRQLWLQELLGLPHPDHYHVPLLCAGDGRRLSKRDGDLDLGTLQAEGVSPEAVLGRLAHWAGLIDRTEPVSLSELLADFDWKRVKREDVTVK